MARPLRLSAFGGLRAADAAGPSPGQASLRALTAALRGQRDGPLAHLHQHLHGPQPDAATLARQLDEAQRVNRQTLRLAELLALHGAQLPRAIALHEAVAEALALREADLRHCGMELAQRLRAATVVAEPGLLVALVHAAIDSMLVRGHRLTVLLDAQPAGPVLAMVSTSQVRLGDESAQPPSSGALQALAAASGVRAVVQRVAAGLQLQLQFAPPPPDDPEPSQAGPLPTGLDAVDTGEPDTGMDSWVASLPGGSERMHALLLTSDRAVVQAVEAACDSLGIRLSVAASADAAARRAAVPQLLMVDDRACDAAFEALRHEWVRERPDMAVVTIGDAAHALALAGWSGRGRLHVGRDMLWSRLPELLAAELPDRG